MTAAQLAALVRASKPKNDTRRTQTGDAASLVALSRMQVV